MLSLKSVMKRGKNAQCVDTFGTAGRAHGYKLWHRGLYPRNLIGCT